MSSVRIIKAGFKRTDQSITGEVTLQVSFSETEIRLDIAFIPGVVVTPSLVSTSGVLIEAIRDSNGSLLDTIMLDECRREVWLPSSAIRPSGRSSFEITVPITVADADLFSRSDAPAKWTSISTGLDIIRAELKLDMSSSASGRLEDLRFSGANPGPNLVGGGTASTQYPNDSPWNERPSGAFNQMATKWLTFHNAAWLQYQFSSTQPTVRSYSLQSANDCPERDPRDWDLLGSNDGASWTLIDSRRGETFADRFQEKLYTCAQPGAYRYYRLNILRNGGAGEIQLAELRLFGGV